MTGRLILITGPRQSGKSTMASDEIIPWLRKQTGNGVVLIDTVHEPNWVTVQGDRDAGYHVCAVIPRTVLLTEEVLRNADLVLRLERVVRFEQDAERDRYGDTPWSTKEMPF